VSSRYYFSPPCPLHSPSILSQQLTVPCSWRSADACSLLFSSHQCDCSMLQQLDDNGQMPITAATVKRRRAVISYASGSAPCSRNSFTTGKWPAFKLATIRGVNTQKPTNRWHVVICSRLEQFLINPNHLFFRLWTMTAGYA
jgi:hypothetical protein